MFDTLVLFWIALAVIVFIAALFITAPYGRHAEKFNGLTIPNKWGWLIMELPSPLIFSIFFLIGDADKMYIHWLFFSFYNLHYINRTFIFPFRLKSGNKPMPVYIMLSAILFNCVNGFINGYYLGHIAVFEQNYLMTLMFITGCSLFIIGAGINLWADHKLINLRKPGETAYKIPTGGLFNKISSPNLFGEIVQWLGWGIMNWHLAAFSFSIWTAANLIPRALDHHRWYKARFSHYPPERKAVIPYLL